MSAPLLTPSVFPAFDRHGNLPVGNVRDGSLRAEASLIYASLADVHRRFVVDYPTSSSRPAIWSGWMDHRRAFEALGVTYSTLVNGSFCTSRSEPSDVDVCYLVDANEVNRLGPAERAEYRRLFDVAHCKSTYQCDPYSVLVYPITHLRFQLTAQGLSYWTRVFGIDRNGRGKAIIMVGERGVP